ncbi:nickel pincer cofactor biosynthesis protein LarC [Fulvivirgaceae bacterium BMA12]|uniref:Putative nickel insertion protein n=1 Tax=Agaribacillus aureus TaxID=3051825 RepID=A0ABT8L203_9BACT|nr:nickel pincer cofactor biosynthesis protein LarC [Fulvivirgaceae bacterium BMA12]
MAILKLETFAGISGDMFLGALTALAEAYEDIIDLPKKLGLGAEVAVQIQPVNKKGIACKHVNIVETEKAGHAHRHLSTINKIIDESSLSDSVKSIAKSVFMTLGKAEAQVHGVDIEKVHFHKVGPLDSIMDIVGAAYLIDRLQVDKTYCTPVNTDYGFANTAHGKLPVPCPATQELLLGLPTYQGDVESEMTTPTGAAILSFLQPSFNMPTLTELKIGYGPGEKDFEIPNTLRASLCQETTNENQMVVIQTSTDDMTGEYLGQEFQTSLMEKGASDFYYEQVVMKKGRPGIVLNVFCPEKAFENVSNFVLENTTTIGLRYYSVNKKKLERTFSKVSLKDGLMQVKRSTTPSGKSKYKPESSDVFKVANKTGERPLDIELKSKIIIENEKD